jgi:Zn-finger nucleic acid-binding protein
MNCPICNENMFSSKKYDIETEYCPQCNEIWPTMNTNKRTIHKVFVHSQKISNGFISNGHIYNKTNDHKLMDDRKRKKELLFSLE